MKTTTTTNIILLSVAILIASNDLCAQGGYISFKGGYGISTASQSLGISGNSDSLERVKGSLGEGLQAGLVIGTMLNSTVGLELGATWLNGSTFQSTYSSSSSYVKNSSEFSANMLRLFPAIRIASANEGTKLYATVGAAIGLGGKRQILESSTHPYYPSTEYTQEYSGGISVGFTGSLGAEFKTGARSFFFTEATIISQSWAPSKAEITSYSVNGQDKLSTLTTSVRETEFVSETSESGFSSSSDPNQPSKQLKSYFPMSSIGINVGFRFMLTKKS